MRVSDSLLKDYLEGNVEKRLYLFLSYRSLRPDFQRIEQAESSTERVCQAESSITQARGIKSIFYPIMRRLRWCHIFRD